MFQKGDPSVLIINYYWPPAGGPAVQRWVDILNCWADTGVTCHVVTVDQDLATYQVTDQSLIDEINPRIKTYRTNTSELYFLYNRYVGQVPANAFVDEQKPSFIKKIARFIRGNIFIPDPRRGWNRFAYQKAREVIQNNVIKIIITAGPPHSTHLIGLKLKKKLKIRWIADFHDYWTDIFYLKDFYRTIPAKWLDKCYEKKVLYSADLVLSHCQYARTLYLEKLKNQAEKKVVVHTLGYNGRLFSSDQRAERQNSFIITYTGMMPENYEPEIVFSVIKRIVQAYPELPIKMRFIGLFSQSIRHIVKSYGLEKHFEETGYVEHREIPSYLYTSTVLLLINPNVKDNRMIVPGKIYEYLAVRKPVISISDKYSENARLIGLCEAGRNFERNDADELFSYLEELIDKWKAEGNADLRHSNNNYLQFSRDHEARILLDRIRGMMNS
ncbi:MAG: glycosyltransferase [Bacteroidales bacterium]|nr:glycosyltransferase [Bacteroidales bacterium]